MKPYLDDRMFLLHVARCSVRPVSPDMVETIIHHEEWPDDALWCLVTYENVPRHPAYRVDHFGSEEDAWAYRREVEPTVPRVSLGGQPPRDPLPWGEWLAWKEGNGLRDYEYESLYLPGGSRRHETIISRRR